MRYILISVLLVVIGYISYTVVYSNTDEGQYNILKKNALDHIEHLSKSRDIGVSKTEILSWYEDSKWESSSPILLEWIREGIEFSFSNPDVSPKNIRRSCEDMIEAKKDFYLPQISNQD